MEMTERLQQSIMRHLPVEVERDGKFTIDRLHLISVMTQMWTDGIDACFEMQRELDATLRGTSPEDQQR